MIPEIPEGHKELKAGQTVTVGTRTYKGSCPAELHPDNLKESSTEKESENIVEEVDG